jgi:hypothetical protein
MAGAQLKAKANLVRVKIKPLTYSYAINNLGTVVNYGEKSIDIGKFNPL